MKQQQAGPDTFAEATEALDELLVAWRRLSVGDSLSRVAIATLSVLDRLGPTRLTTLAEHEVVSQPAMTGLVGRLERSGLVTRETDPSDGRAVLVTLTAPGRELIQDRRSRFVTVIERMLGDLDTDSFGRLVEALPALRQLAAMAHDTKETP